MTLADKIWQAVQKSRTVRRVKAVLVVAACITVPLSAFNFFVLGGSVWILTIIGVFWGLVSLVFGGFIGIVFTIWALEELFRWAKEEWRKEVV